MTGTPEQRLILLHGALGDSSQFDGLRAALLAEMTLPMMVHAMDFEGHGSARDRGRPYRMDSFVDNVLAELDRLGIERVSIFGYSMGGYVGMCLAAREPARVDRVMTLGTRFRWTAEVAEHETRRLDPRRLEEKVPLFARALAARHSGAGWELVLARTAEMMHDLAAGGVLPDDQLAAVPVPVRIAVGDRDATVSVEESAEVARLVPRGELEVFPNTPHPLERVAVDRLARSIAGFVR